MCQLEAIWYGMSKEVVGRWNTGRGETYNKIIRWKIPWPDFRMDLTAGSMIVYWRQMHGNEQEMDWNWLSVSHTEHLPHMFDVRFPKGTYQCQRPFPGFLGLSCTWNIIWNHFNWKHWEDSLIIMEEPPQPTSSNAISAEDRCHIGV